MKIRQITITNKSRLQRNYLSAPSALSLNGVTLPLPVQTASRTTHKADQKFSNGRRSRQRLVLLSCIGVFVLATALSSLFFYPNYIAQYHRDMVLAREGIQHLQTAEGSIKNLSQVSLDSPGIMQVRQEFAAAFSDFSQIKNDLEQIPGIATIVPKYGSLLSTALKLVPLAVEVSQAGMVGCDALTIVVSRLHSPLDLKSQGITIDDITIIKKDVAQLQGILNTAAGQVSQLQPSDLQVEARLGSAVAAFRTELPKLQTGLQNIQALLNVAPTLLGIGQPASYLIEQLDSTEIRPGGGFIGSYGIVAFSGGRLANIQMRDTYLLDNAFLATGRSIAYPPAYKAWFHPVNSWTLRDSNLDADFPTAARYAEQLYSTEGGTVPLQGVIAITPGLVENALKITGPIYVPEYHETITLQNIVDRIHFHQLEGELKGGDVPSPDGHSSLRKRFTELLFEHFFARVRQIWSTDSGKFVALLRTSLSTKDFQVYLNSSTAEDVLQHYQVASIIQAPLGDGLFIVDANIKGGKANNFIHYTLQDEVTIDVSGNAIHRTTLIYYWPVSANQFQNGSGVQNLYSDYLRVFTPLGSTLLAQSGWIPRGTSETFGREVWAGLLHLPYGKTRTINLTWMVHGAATYDAKSRHYHYLIQRQAGIMWHLNLQISLPACAQVTNTAGKPAFNNEHNGIVSQDLATDLDIDVTYRC